MTDNSVYLTKLENAEEQTMLKRRCSKMNEDRFLFRPRSVFTISRPRHKKSESFGVTKRLLKFIIDPKILNREISNAEKRKLLDIFFPKLNLKSGCQMTSIVIKNQQNSDRCLKLFNSKDDLEEKTKSEYLLEKVNLGSHQISPYHNMEVDCLKKLSSLTLRNSTTETEITNDYCIEEMEIIIRRLPAINISNNSSNLHNTIDNSNEIINKIDARLVMKDIRRFSG
ncbi:uncharacterized protein [Prorops nasuta]|uniref:uncharacterized protein n=1 Tax=Prorops nasuta TaxID=863751 RepID=UPI0034CFFA57